MLYEKEPPKLFAHKQILGDDLRGLTLQKLVNFVIRFLFAMSPPVK